MASSRAPKSAPSGNGKAANATESVHLSAIANVRASFESLKQHFTLPVPLVFQHASTSENVKVAFTSEMSPLHQYEESLTKLLLKLDAVESDGDETVRAARKACVNDIESELARIDTLKKQEWQKQHERTSQSSTRPSRSNRSSPDRRAATTPRRAGMASSLTGEDRDAARRTASPELVSNTNADTPTRRRSPNRNMPRGSRLDAKAPSFEYHPERRTYRHPNV